MSFTTNQLRDVSSLFSRSEVYRWFQNDFESINLKLERYNLLERNRGNSYLSVLRKSYKILEKHYPNEYILKNEFLNQWLRNELGNGQSVIFNELRIGKAIADLAMFNGVSKAFEIKTILDKEFRLSSQLQEYKKLFNEVYIIIPKVQLSKYLSYGDDIGIITYETETKQFVLIQKPQRNNIIDPNVLMEVLHSKEYLNITSQYFKGLPKMNSFTQFEICKKLIASIPSGELNRLFVETMKRRDINNLFFKRINRELNQICLSLNLKQSDRDKLIRNLKTNTV